MSIMQRIKIEEPVTRDCTIHLHKHMQKVAFKKRAPRAVRVVRHSSGATAFETPTSSHNTQAENSHQVPRRVRVRLSRKRNEDEDAKEKMFTLVQHVPVESFKNLQTETVKDD
eukprot:g12782.t1